VKACVNPQTGAVRIVLGACARGEEAVPLTTLLSTTPTGQAGTPGPEGPAGPAGAEGPAGPAGAGAHTIVDANGLVIGTMHLLSGMVERRFGSDVVLLPVTPQGFVRADVTFYHTTADCSGDRFLPNNNGLFAYMGYLVGNSVFYTTLSNPSEPARTFRSARTVTPAGNSSCATGFAIDSWQGTAVMATDSALGSFALPFRLQ
jgi:hypothetical protein